MKQYYYIQEIFNIHILPLTTSQISLVLNRKIFMYQVLWYFFLTEGKHFISMLMIKCSCFCILVLDKLDR